MNLSLEKLEDLILTEDNLAAILGVGVKQLAYLRKEKGLPCVYVTRQTRIYLGPEIYQFLEKLSEA